MVSLPSDGSLSTAKPSLKGKIKSLSGLITSTAYGSSAAYANTCTNARILLMDLWNVSVLMDNPLASKTLGSDTAFEFDPSDLGLDLSRPHRYMLQTTGCLVNYGRIISSFYNDQNLDESSTLISKVINTRIASVMNTVSAANLERLQQEVTRGISEGDNFEDVFGKIHLTPAMKQLFQTTFQGGATEELKEAAPDINAITVHRNLSEKTSAAFSVSAFHWDSTYQIAQEWRVNGVTEAMTPTWNYSPKANSRASTTITLRLGHKNTSDSNVDTTKPYHELNFTVSISDTHPALAAPFTLSASSTTPTATRILSLDVATGSLSGTEYANCETFSTFAIVENSTIPTDSDFIHSCDQGPTKTISHTLNQVSDGAVSLKLWARDIEGRVSALPWDVSLVLDTTAPSIQYQNLQSTYVADSDVTFNWMLTEPNATASQVFAVELFDGSSWTALPDVALTSGPHVGAPFSTTTTLPNLSVTGAKLRITYSDTLGHETIAESAPFNILRASLSSNPLSLSFGSVLNKTTSSSQALNFMNTGAAVTQLCTSVSLGGADASDFMISSEDCSGSAIGIGSSCPVAVSFRPHTKGTKTGTITITCGPDSFSTSLSGVSSNNAPVVATTTAVSTNEDTSTTISFGALSDGDGDSVTYSFTTNPSNGTLSNCQASSGYHVCTYTPNANFHGADSIVFKSNDGSVDSNNGTINVTVIAQNDAPTLASTQAVTTSEDTPVSFTLNSGADVDGDALTYSIVSSPASGSLSCSGTSCTYSPALDFNGNVTFTYKVNDGTLDSNTATVTISVSDANDPPIIGADQSHTTNEDTALSLVLNPATDVDLPAQTLTYRLVSAPSKGVLTGCINVSTYVASRNCTYTPDLNATGTDTFTFRANDGLTDSSAVTTVTITITPQNDAPVLAATQAATTPEDTPLSFTLNPATDVENDPLTYAIVTNSANGSVTCTGQSCTFTPAANYNGTASFTYKANDGALDSNTATVSITVTPVNDPPVMGLDQSFTVADATGLSFNLNAASDIDGGALSYKLVSPPSHGTLSNCIVSGSYGTDRSCDYISNVNYHGTDSFTYTAYDTYTDSLTVATVTITISDLTPPSAPAISLASVLYTNSTSVTLTASTCSDTPQIFINESTAPSAAAAGWQTCALTAGHLSYVMGATQGQHTLKVWSKDAQGNVSTSASDIVVYYDTVAPALTLTTPPALAGGQAYSLAWTVNETYSSSTLNYTVEAFDGSSWSTVGTTASTTGTLTAASFSRSWTPPSVNTTGALFRVSFTDRAGNSSTATSSAFTIDSTAPSVAITSPAAGSYHLSSVTVTGTCEAGRSVSFSGDIQTPFSITCPSGSFTQLLNFSNEDGNKTIIASQTDAVGNQGTTSRIFVRDELAPILTRTSGQSPFFTKNDVPNAWGGTCEGNYTISVTGSEATSFNCNNGSWVWTPSPKTTDGIFAYNLVQTDGAGNTSSPPLNLSWERDATAPAFTINTPFIAATGSTTSFTSNQNSFTVSGNCEGITPITISGAATAVISCSSASCTWTAPSVTTDGARSYVFTHSDSAGNTSTITANWTRDTSGPSLSLAKALIKSNTNTTVFNGTCQAGIDVSVSGAETATVPCPAGLWTFTTANQAVDAKKLYSFTQTFSTSPFNSTSASGTWIRETDAPVVSSFTTTAPYPSRSSYIPVSMSASSQNSEVYLSHLCIRLTDSTKPSDLDTCFQAVNSPAIGGTLAQTFSLVNHNQLMTWTPGSYTAFMWVKDEAGNISNLTASGVGTNNIDKIPFAYSPGVAPTVWNVSASNDAEAPLPPSRYQSEAPAGTDVFIKWSATDDAPLPAGSISLFYTSDELSFTEITRNLSNTDYGCGITLAANEGCYRWVGGSPLNTAYKIRVRVTDSGDITSQLISNPLNSGLLKILAGNTESGINGSARTAMFFTYRDGVDHGTIVVDKKGNLYFSDYKRGIITVDQTDGKQKVFIPLTGASSGDGGPAVNATLTMTSRITLDYQNRLLIRDLNRIRRVDLNASTPTIETIIGGGSDTSDVVNDPKQINIYPYNLSDIWDMSAIFFALPNGDIYFHSERAIYHPHEPFYRFRIYQAATGQIISKYISGFGNVHSPSIDILKCRIVNPGLAFNPSTSVITHATATNLTHSTTPGCDNANDHFHRVKLDPLTFQALPNTDNFAAGYHSQTYTGMDGRLYISIHRAAVYRLNDFNNWDLVVGGNMIGECADGTLATACRADIQNFFVTASGKMYFTDRGTIRTIDENGKVLTLFGQRLSYGDGVNALNARIGAINQVFQLNNGKILFGDGTGVTIKEFTIEGNVDVVAGNGAQGDSIMHYPAKYNSIYDAATFTVDRSTGDVYTGLQSGTYGNYARLLRSTGMWEHIIGRLDDSGTHYSSADGAAGMDVNGAMNEYSRSYPLAFDNNHLLLQRMRMDYSNSRWGDFMIKSYDATDSFRQSHIAGIVGFHPGHERYSCSSGNAVPGTSCEIGYWDTYQKAKWDPVMGRWLLAQVHGGNENELYEVYPGGNFKRIAVTSHPFHNSFHLRWEAGQEILYYCDNYKIIRHNVTTNTHLGALPWSMDNLYCRGLGLEFNSTNNSLVFGFIQNGLYGVAEYYLPP